MPKAEAGSAKAVGNAMKARGLTQLRFYCQICSKACRDANGFKCHIESESHMRQIQVLGDNGANAIDGFSKEFQKEFVQLLSRRFGTRRIKANQVYQEYIQERHHLHMNATKWLTLTDFIKHLGREGIVKVDETEQGWFISWVDNSPAALAKADSLKKLERAKLDDEMRMRKALEEQIERAKAEKGGEEKEEEGKKEGLDREKLNGNGGGIKLNIGFKKPSPPASEKDQQQEVKGTNSNSGLQSIDSSSTAATSSTSTSTSSNSGSGGLRFIPSSSSTTTNPSKPLSNATLFKTGPSNPLKSNSNPLKSGSNPLKSNSNPLKSKSPSSSSSSSSSKGSNPQQQQARTAAERIIQEELERKRKNVGPVMNTNIKRQKW